VLLVFDVGNTETTLGLFDAPARRDALNPAVLPPLVANWRITTDVARTPDEFGLLLHGLLASARHPIGAIEAVAIGSVVPPITVPLVDACKRYLSCTPVVIDARSVLPIQLDVDEPLTVGADRLINTLAAKLLYRRDTIVVDLGTATTFDCITADGRFFGGVIMPGVRTMAETLVRRTSKLPATEIVAPARAIGRRTEECIRSGVVFGAADAIDGLVRRIRAEWPSAEVPLVVATGGLAPVLAPHCSSVDRVEPNLTLIGLQLAEALVGRGAGDRA
jgi:type III pantothenate kinase